MRENKLRNPTSKASLSKSFSVYNSKVLLRKKLITINILILDKGRNNRGH